MEQRQKVDSRRVGLAALLLAIGWFLLGIYVLHAAVDPESPSLPLERTIHIDVLLPQRWALFTIDAQTKYPTPFRREGNAWKPIEPSYRGRHFGFDRAILSPITEAHELTQDLSDAEWKRCERTVAYCVASLSPLHVVNESNIARLCGDIAVIKRSIVPWEERLRRTAEPFQIVLLRVAC
jgi:hypothetical protein